MNCNYIIFTNLKIDNKNTQSIKRIDFKLYNDLKIKVHYKYLKSKD